MGRKKILVLYELCAWYVSRAWADFEVFVAKINKHTHKSASVAFSATAINEREYLLFAGDE